MGALIRLQPFDRPDFEKLISWIDNENLLVQVAGRQLTFPVTVEQLINSQLDPRRHAFSIVDFASSRPVGHCELYLLDQSAKIDRLIIGDPAMRGKGLCKAVIHLLLDYGFNVLSQERIELNVFDWNKAAIRCYENAGLRKNVHGNMVFEMNGEPWTAFNMSIDRSTYRTKIPG
jgi:RimJ/RimL family protein N-acetyltransferase